MPYDYNTLPHAGIQELHPYVPGKATSTLAREQKSITDIIKLASNENPLGCSPHALEALRGLTPADLATYPILINNPLRDALALHAGLNRETVALSNGSDMLFHLLLECFALHTGKHVLTHDYAFITYEVQANTLGIPIKKVPVKPQFEVDIDALINACTQKTAIIFLANPNNPTGRLIPPDEIIRLLDNIPDSTLLVLDEAYHEYTPPNMQLDIKKSLTKYSNLVITRTFSKVYGLAALRLGYAFANPDITALLYRIQLPFTVNQAATVAALSALNDQDFVQESIHINKQGLTQIKQGLTALGLTCLPSACNFIMFNCERNARELDQHLQARGLIIRPLNPYDLTQHLRVTIGTFEQNARFLKTLPICLKETSS
jgi:histidinol-phosphate aminotransferase